MITSATYTDYATGQVTTEQVERYINPEDMLDDFAEYVGSPDIRPCVHYHHKGNQVVLMLDDDGKLIDICAYTVDRPDYGLYCVDKLEYILDPYTNDDPDDTEEDDTEEDDDEDEDMD